MNISFGLQSNHKCTREVALSLIKKDTLDHKILNGLLDALKACLGFNEHCDKTYAVNKVPSSTKKGDKFEFIDDGVTLGRRVTNRSNFLFLT